MKQPLLNALSLIENIYDSAMYDNGDMFRIKDIIHSLSSNQISSKEWLAYEFKKQYYYSAGKILILGGWYGLLAYCLRQRFPREDMNIVSIDKDPMCENIAWKLFPDIDAKFITADAFDFDMSNYSAIISTSVEHIEQDFWTKLIKEKEKNTWVCLQSNNYFDHPTHINCSQSVSDFVEGLNIDWVGYQGAIDNHAFQRFMVIGK